MSTDLPGLIMQLPTPPTKKMYEDEISCTDKTKGQLQKRKQKELVTTLINKAVQLRSKIGKRTLVYNKLPADQMAEINCIPAKKRKQDARKMMVPQEDIYVLTDVTNDCYDITHGTERPEPNKANEQQSASAETGRQLSNEIIAPGEIVRQSSEGIDSSGSVEIARREAVVLSSIHQSAGMNSDAGTSGTRGVSPSIVSRPQPLKKVLTSSASQPQKLSGLSDINNSTKTTPSSSTNMHHMKAKNTPGSVKTFNQTSVIGQQLHNNPRRLDNVVKPTTPLSVSKGDPRKSLELKSKNASLRMGDGMISASDQLAKPTRQASISSRSVERITCEEAVSPPLKKIASDSAGHAKKTIYGSTNSNRMTCIQSSITNLRCTKSDKTPTSTKVYHHTVDNSSMCCYHAT